METLAVVLMCRVRPGRALQQIKNQVEKRACSSLARGAKRTGTDSIYCRIVAEGCGDSGRFDLALRAMLKPPVTQKREHWPGG